MDVELYSAIVGALIAGVFGLIVLAITHLLRRRGGIEFTPSDWRFAYLRWPEYEQHKQPDGTLKTVAKYRLYEPIHQDYKPSEVSFAIYGCTADVLNRMDVADVLREVSVAFKKDGAILFTHRPFDADNTPDASGIVFEVPMKRERLLANAEGLVLPGEGIEPVGPISLPNKDSKRIRLKGYISPPDLHYLHGGCDEVRLLAKRENGKLFDEHVTSLITTPLAQPPGKASVGMIGT